MASAQKEPKLRVQRAESLFQKLLGSILPDYLPEQSGLVTVSRVEVSNDMRYAKVWLSILGGDDKRVMSALEKQLYDIQGDLNRKIPMKIVPRIQFSLDTSPRFAQHISEIINKLDITHEP